MPENDDTPVRLDTRLAGQLRRYHTWPVIGQQTVAEHCWQIMRIYLSVVDVPDPHMMYHITFHDIGEHFTGDIPYPVKRDNPQLKEQMEFLEQRSYMTQLEYWGAFHMARLSDYDKKLFKNIELTEMAEFGLDQVCLGNSYAFVIADRCLRSVYNNNPDTKLIRYIMKRLELFFLQCRNEMEPFGDWWSYAKWHAKLEEPHGCE